MSQELEREQEQLKRRQTEILNALQKDFESEKQQRRERFSMQLSRYMKSVQSFDEMDESDEKRELSVSNNIVRELKFI
jgi:hypothetical protein